MQIDINQISFSNYSMMDNFGRVFFYKGRVFRAIYESQKNYCLSLLESSLFRELIDCQYIPNTWIVDFKLESFALILEHEFIYDSKPQHWSFNMYKDVALFILKLNKKCNTYGYEVKDAHPYNVFFKQNKPIFIDIGSITPKKNPNSWIAYDEYITSMYIQLLLWERGEYFLTRKLIEDGTITAMRTIPMSNILDSSFTKIIETDLFNFLPDFRNKSRISILPKHGRNLFIRIINKILNILIRSNVSIESYKKELKSLSFIEEKINNLNQPISKSIWEDYHDYHRQDSNILMTPRFDRIINLIKEKALDIKTSIDLAGNQGVFSYLLSQQVSLDRVIVTDYDEKAIGIAYNWLKENHIDIQPYLFNFMIPFSEDEIRAFKSDIVFALAITHHLILTQNYILTAIFEKIAEYSNKYVVIEFMPIGLWDGGKVPEVPEWYNLDWFRNEFCRFFKIIHEEKIEVNRVVFFGKIQKMEK